ncbi:4'-phosphopantetheinyl transferase family protein [Streptomyces flaveolus]|uniref:4'-phosphopantetheinyl transferase family protein n=1 Tax=Streptomyces flaveolus TaxID=67297 RepID=UPI0019ACB7AD|nr:4'-phosphopantetheinyl transferase superfamily protein [Streptomyces flaveolus]GGQ57769.1 phosphopantetheine-protein transferase [Streptomyces flaveolus]
MTDPEGVKDVDDLPGKGVVELWLLSEASSSPVREPVVGYGILDDAERSRARSFPTPGGRRRYVQAHVALRTVLARYTGQEPADVRFTREGTHGRPVLRDASLPRFSLSHSHGLVAVAVAVRAVGVDVQRWCPPGTVEACLPRLHPAEREEVGRLSGDSRVAAFCRLWARKEAYLKALGTGLSRPPRADYLGDGDRAARPTGWSVRDVTAPDGYAAATALRGDVPHRVTVRHVEAVTGLSATPD